MQTETDPNSGSIEPAPAKAALGGHPLHPMLVPFPIAALTFAPLCDILGRTTRDAFWARCSLWLLGTGLVTGLVAALAGLVDFLGVKRARDHLAGWIHLGGNVLAMLLTAGNFLRRLRHPSDEVSATGMGLSIAVFLILGVTGWLGGELAYRHKIGVTR